MSDSLVRVSRRAEWGAHRPTPGARSAEARQGRALPSTIAMMTSPRAYHSPGLGHHRNPRRSMSRVDRRTGSHRSTSDRTHRRPPSASLPTISSTLDSLFKVLFIFPSRYLFAIGLSPVFSLGRNLPPDWGCIPKQPDSPTAPRVRQGPGTTGLSPSLAPPSRGLGPGPPLRTLLQTTIRTPRATDFHGGLFPVRSPLLRESLLVSFPPLIDMLNSAGRRALGLMASGATCVQRLDGSRDSAIHTKYRISLRSSSMQEPRYPLPRVIVCKCCVVTTPADTVSGPPGVALNRFEFLAHEAPGFVFVARTRRPGARGAVSSPPSRR
uniref:Uncharacterized protein n=1 Tax=Glycine max TaxID=3847 RepID=A0A0R0GH08_SOYBN